MIDLIQILKQAWALYKRDPYLLISLGLISGLAAVMDSILPNIFRIKSLPVILICTMFISSVATIALIYAGYALYHRKFVTFQEALIFARSKFLIYLAVSIVYGLLVFSGLMLFFIPGIYLMVIFFFSYIIAVVDYKGFQECFQQSAQLVRGYFAVVLLFNVLMSVIYVFPIVLLQSIPLVGNTLSVLLTVGVFPYYVLAQVVLYLKLKKIKESHFD